MADVGELVDAAARVVRILGETALSSSVARLVERASDINLLFGGGVPCPCDNLRAAVEALRQADSVGRSEAVLGLLNAATTLEYALGVKLDALRGNAWELAQKCRELQQAEDDIEEVRRGAAGREEPGEGRPVGLWWLMIGWIPRRHDRTVENMEMGSTLLVKESPRRREPSQASGEIGAAAAATTTVEFASSELTRRATKEKVLTLARSVQSLLDVLGMPPHQLVKTMDALAKADNIGTALADLGVVAIELERQATTELLTLREPVAQLRDACREHQQAAAAMDTVQRFAEQRAQQRDNASATVQNERPPEPAPDQGNGLSSMCSAMLGTVLLGALALLPYMGGADDKHGLLQPTVCTYRRTIGSSFAWLWCIVGAGVPCLMGSHPLLHWTARILGRAGMLAATLLVIYYCHWSMAPDWTDGVRVLAFSAVCVHVLLLGMAWYKGDLRLK